jgi:hypothetical protein
LELNIYHIGSPGGTFRIKIGKFIIKYNLLRFFNIKCNVHIAGFILINDQQLCKKLIKNNYKKIGYQHGGGYGMNTINSNKEILISDNYIFWNHKIKSTIHRWGYRSKITLFINSFFKKKEVKLILPTLSTKFNEIEKIMIYQQNFSKELVSSNFSSIPNKCNICWDPRDKERTIPLEKKTSVNDIFLFIGIPSTFVWYCIKFNIKFYIIDDGSFDYVESINFKGFSNESIDYIKYLKTKIITKNEKNVYNI